MEEFDFVVSESLFVWVFIDNGVSWVKDYDISPDFIKWGVW